MGKVGGTSEARRWRAQIELPPGEERSDNPNSRKQIVRRRCTDLEAPGLDFLRAFFRAIAGAGKSERGICLDPSGSSFPFGHLPYGNRSGGHCRIFQADGLAGNNSGRLDAIELAVKRIETRLAAPGLGRTAVANPTTLLVAVQFVTAAAERSTPFDTALAVAISMTGEHPKIGPLLDQLLAEATTGVPSLEDLRRDFQAKLARIRKGRAVHGYWRQAGDILVSLEPFSGFGRSGNKSGTSGNPAKSVAADVANQNLGEAVQLVAKLDGRVREGLEDWREKAAAARCHRYRPGRTPPRRFHRSY